MATQCRSSKCTAERKGFRRELDSWRHKLIHCVGFESILEGIYGPRLLQDLNIFDDCEPETVDDWSMDAGCSFCNLPIEKINDNSPTVASPPSPPAAETPPPQVLPTSEKLQCQANRFLHAVFHKKEFPPGCDHIIPLAAQELMHKMIRQFALEYACKSQMSEGQNSVTANPDSACLQNQADPDGPLDLTVSRSSSGPEQADGVLDLSKKNFEKVPAHQRVSGRLLRKDCVVRSSDFAEGLLSKALKDIRSGLLDIHKAAILYGIPQKTLRLQTEALSPKGWAAELKNSARQNGSGSDGFSQVTDARLVLQKVATWAQSQSERPELGKLLIPSGENLEFSSFLHNLTLQRLVSQHRDKNEALLSSEPSTTPPPQSPASPAVHIRIPQVRPSTTSKTTVDLAGLVDTVYQATKTSIGVGGATQLQKLKTILPKQGASDCPAPRLLQADLPPLCLNLKHGSASGSPDDCGDEADRRDKQPRKKRGRYRQYDHDILEEAIGMVMNGKMSVSKAQGIYGVPHSTLEYKVKERLGTLKTPPKKKPRQSEGTMTGAGNSGTTTNASTTAFKRF
ncbi:ligand-dependent nuclear receptor corepressor-like protein [Chanos chanos]|uniref:Ligand-dependent nuclear receptor corepressor-like protein n=1 Tax=Chanos chanos TaxID=29144 RepID=A0A6J2WJM2_CHACN|nr:ligand-dependent nuclear receptor corepressor-like protein [Chanos chanos]